MPSSLASGWPQAPLAHLSGVVEVPADLVAKDALLAKIQAGIPVTAEEATAEAVSTAVVDEGTEPVVKTAHSQQNNKKTTKLKKKSEKREELTHAKKHMDEEKKKTKGGKSDHEKKKKHEAPMSALDKLMLSDEGKAQKLSDDEKAINDALLAADAALKAAESMSATQ